jgi:Ca2+-transporting ATPase
MVFMTLSASKRMRTFTVRSEYMSVFKIGVFSSRWMVGATVLLFLLVLTVVYIPFLQPFFYSIIPTPDDWPFMLPFFLASPIAMELIKIYIRLKKAGTLRTSRNIARKRKEPTMNGLECPAEIT